MKTVKLTLLILTIILNSCSNDENNEDIKPIIEDTYDIYVVGLKGSGGSNSDRAIYWKNGIATELQPDTRTKATAVVVVNEDVYVAGKINTSACYWKNKTRVDLPDGTEAKDIAVVGSDVYVVGHLNDVACYWKNGIKTILGENAKRSSASAIAIAGNDIYIAGYESPDRTSYAFKTVYWKNDIKTVLDVGIANSIAVDGNDVYIGGDTANANCAYWKNNELVVGNPLEENNSANGSGGLSIDNNNVYVAGNGNGNYLVYAVYWKNGIPTTLEAPKYNFNSKANDIKAMDNNVFICGYKTAENGNEIPILWINKKETILDSGESDCKALGIFVVKKEN